MSAANCYSENNGLMAIFYRNACDVRHDVFNKACRGLSASLTESVRRLTLVAVCVIFNYPLPFREDIVKKIIFVVMLNMFFIGFCFGQFKISNDIALTGGYSFYTVKTGDEYTINNGSSFGISYALHIGDRIGVGMYSNFIYIPKSVGGDPVEGWSTVKSGDGIFLFGFDFLMGPVFMLVNTPKIKVPLAVGMHTNLFMAFFDEAVIMALFEDELPFPSGTEGEYTEANYGVGFNIGVEFYFSRKVYFLCRIQGSFDFINIKTAKIKIPASGSGTITAENSDFGFSSAWGFIPQVGIGIRF